jgi:uncharacterized protein
MPRPYAGREAGRGHLRGAQRLRGRGVAASSPPASSPLLRPTAEFASAETSPAGLLPWKFSVPAHSVPRSPIALLWYDVKALPLTSSARSASHRRHQRLLDVFGALLTDHQREACRLHLDEDWSVTELAEHLECTRSGAHDLIRRAVAQLEHFEERLGLVAELDRRDAVEAELRRHLLILGWKEAGGRRLRRANSAVGRRSGELAGGEFGATLTPAKPLSAAEMSPAGRPPRIRRNA